MKKIMAVVLLVVLLTISLPFTEAQADGEIVWWQSDAGIGRRNYGLAIDPQTPSTLYAGTQGPGVFKSVNGEQAGVQPTVFDRSLHQNNCH